MAVNKTRCVSLWDTPLSFCCMGGREDREFREDKEFKEFKEFKENREDREFKDLRKREGIYCQSGTDVALTRKSHRWVVLDVRPIGGVD